MTNDIKPCSNCTGCSACSVVCPTGAMSMKTDDEGFYRYIVDYNKCVNCKLCYEVCANHSEATSYEEEFEQKYYAARNTDLEIVRSSSSGGMFTAFSKAIICEGGSVYGAIIDYPTCSIEYKRATTIEETYPMRGSKYIQARMSKDIIEMLIEDINRNIPVLFTGTSCYVNGIKRLLKLKKIKAENVVFMDFICAGVISNKLWMKTVDYYTQKIGILKKISFRDKCYGWRDFGMSWDSGEKIAKAKFVLSEVGLLQSKKESLGRACCECKYSSYERPGDITVGDFWNEQYLPHKWWDDKGVSTIMVNSYKGESLLQKCIEYIELVKVQKNMVFNSRFIKTEEIINEECRDELYSDADNLDYISFYRKWIKCSFKSKVLLGIIRPLFLKIGLHRYKK